MPGKRIEKIIINFPTNLGDTVLGLRVLDRLRANYQEAKITAIASPRTLDFLNRVDSLSNIIVFNKHWSGKEKLEFVLSLIGKYDLIADLKNSWLPIILGVNKRTPFIRIKNPSEHVKEAYINLLKKIAPEEKYLTSNINLTLEEEKKWQDLKLKPSIFIACSSRSSLKCYNQEYLFKLLELLNLKYDIVIIGDKEEENFYAGLEKFKKVHNLVGNTKLHEIFYLLKNYCRCLISVDSGLLHIASYLNIAIVGLFGPTSDKLYGPWSQKFIVLKNELLNCSPCAQAQCPKNNRICMDIDPKIVFNAVEKII